MSEPGTSDGVVLRTTAVGESDLVVMLYTRAHGRVSAIARGARSSRRRFGGALGMLIVSDHVLGRRLRGGELWSLERAIAIHDRSALAADPIALGHASYALELVRELTPEETPDPAILDLVIELWDALATGPSPRALRGFELRLCELLGSAVALDRCVGCGRGDDLDDGAVFDPARGGVVCRRCAPTSRGLGVRPLPAAARRHLLAVAAAPLGAGGGDGELGDDDRVAARDAMLAFVGHLVGKPLKSVAFVAQVHAGLTTRR
ncbi:MAG TPA: DNA repair protein RecO [Kofleriaceae bacterium]|nr:DNA repair protein RecO [Kofleriaceae bacterium]